MRRAYVTGATGAIGMALVARLLEEKVEVTVFIQPDSKRKNQLDIFKKYVDDGQLNIIYASLGELAGLHVQADKKTEDNVFFHLGWAGTFGESRNDIKLQELNVRYANDAVKLANRLGCHKYIGIGSMAEYKRIDGVLTEESECEPYTEYGKAKLRAYDSTKKTCDEFGLEHAWIRVFSVYGPFDGEYTMVSQTIKKLLDNQIVDLTLGIQIWDYIYSEDAARAIYLVGEKATGLYNLGSGCGRALRDYITTMCRVVGADESLLGFGAVEYGPNQVMHLLAGTDRIEKETGFVPEVDFEEGIKKTISFIKKGTYYYEKEN